MGVCCRLSESYAGILDQEAGVIESMGSSAFTPMVLPVLFILIPICAAVATGITLNLEFPRAQPGEYGWANLAVWYPLEIWYVVRKWKESLKNPWLTLRYWVGKRSFTNDFQLIDWEQMGKVDQKTQLAASKYGPINKPKNELAGDLIYEFRLRNKQFPKLIVALKEVPDIMLSFVGNIGMVQNGGLLFESRNIAAASFVRCDFTKDSKTEFIPIGVFSDCAHIAEDIKEERKIELPKLETIAAAAGLRDTHYAGLYERKWLDSERIRENIEKQEKDISKMVDERVGTALKEMSKSGQIPTGGVGKRGSAKLPGSRSQWIFIVVFITVAGLVTWRLLVH